MPPFRVQGEKVKGTNVFLLRCHGELDAHTFEVLDEEFQNVFDEGIRQLIVDLSDVPYMSSAGIGVLVGASNEVEDDGGGVIVLSPSATVLGVFRDMGFDNMFTIVNTMEEACAALGVTPPGGAQRPKGPDHSGARRKGFD